MDAAVRHVVDDAGVALVDAVCAASTTPARLLGLSDRGSIAVGLRADLVVLGPDLRTEAVWVGGQPAYG
jgi:N-acetylglucosamine-6-phosphate deacetylase